MPGLSGSQPHRGGSEPQLGLALAQQSVHLWSTDRRRLTGSLRPGGAPACSPLREDMFDGPVDMEKMAVIPREAGVDVPWAADSSPASAQIWVQPLVGAHGDRLRGRENLHAAKKLALVAGIRHDGCRQERGGGRCRHATGAPLQLRCRDVSRVDEVVTAAYSSQRLGQLPRSTMVGIA